MSYDLHIEREDVLDPITVEQWEGYIAADPEMAFAPGGEVAADLPDGDKLSYANRGLAFWTVHPRAGTGGRWDPPAEGVTFDYRGGGVHVSGPDEETTGKMCRVAAKLGARVEGDDGEIYDAEDYP